MSGYSGHAILRRVLAIVVAVAAGSALPLRAQEGADQTIPETTSTRSSGQTQRLAAVVLQGELTEKAERLLGFLGLTAGAPFGQSDQNRVDQDLKALGYRQVRTEIEPLGGGLVRLRLTVEPVRVVRNVVVKRNWPLFDDEIIRHLSLRTGNTLPSDSELRDRLQEEAEAVKKYLFNEGYFEANVVVEPHIAMLGVPGRPRPRWIDLVVKVDLGASYKLGDVEASYDHEDGEHHLPRQALYDIFHHWLRFKVSQMREDQRKAEKALRDLGFPAARVVCDFDFARDADRKTHRILLRVRVSIKRKVEVKFVGNRAITARDLRDQLTIFNAGAFDEVELTESARALQREYQKHGYFEARVTFRRALKRGPLDPATGRPRDEVEEVSFSIDEGPELKVQKVEIVSESGQPLTFDALDLKDKAQLETKPFPPLGSIGLGEGGYVTQLQLQQDSERLVTLYKSRGFPAVKVRSEVARDPAAFDALGAFGADVSGAGGGHALYVRFFVEEGRREIVDHVEIAFVGPHVKDEIDVYKAVQLGAGRSYTGGAEEDDLAHIGDVYKSSGHPFVTIDPTTSSWNKEHDRVVLRYVITEGPEVRFGEVLIRGNFKTHGSTIRNDLPFKPGDLYDINKIEAGERNLQTHLIFNAARVVGVLERGRTVAPVLVTVQERYLDAYGSLTFAVGAASDRLPDYLYASSSYLWANALGYGSQLELKGDVAVLALMLRHPVTWGISLRYTDLRLLGPGWRLDLQGSWRNEVTNRFGEIQVVGASIGITRNLTPSLRTYLRYDVYQANLNVGFVRLLGSNDAASAADNTITTRVVSGLVWDRRVGSDGLPNPLAAVKGWLLSGAVGYAHKNLVTDNPFVVLSGQAMGILPFKVKGAQFTLLGNLRYDQGIPTNEPALPLVERFYAGGDTTTRGYDTDALKNEVVRSNISPLGLNAGFRIVPEGGNIRMLNTVEMQFPIARSFLGLPLQWSGAIFWDVGAITNGLDQLRGSDLKSAIGISLLRLVTPVGPLSIEYAYPLNQGLAEERWKTAPWYSHYPGRIHFNWGIPLSRL
ncbi:MAG: outer membrane protein assembly factor BamA [Myxococcales bacterium]|nr:outer membrane protein assembly factor BamA [Myxococcales bacterium]